MVTNLTDGATISWNGSTGTAYALTVAGDHTMASPTSLVDGAIYSLMVTQGSGGQHSLTWSSAYLFEEGRAPKLSTAQGDVDLLMFHSDGVNLSLVSVAYNLLNAVPPLAATGVAATTDQVGQITLTWTNNATDATSIEVQSDYGIGFAYLDAVGASAVTYVDVLGSACTATYRVVTHKASATPSMSSTAAGTAV